MKPKREAVPRVLWIVVIWALVAAILRFLEADCFRQFALCASQSGDGLRDLITLRWGEDNAFHDYQALFAGMLAFGGGYWVLQAAIVQANAASEAAAAVSAREREKMAIENDRLRAKRLSALDSLAKKTMLSVQKFAHQLDQVDPGAEPRIHEALSGLLRLCEQLVDENPALAVWTQQTALAAARARLLSMQGQGGETIALNGRILKDALTAFYEKPERLTDSATQTLRVVKASPPRSLGPDRVHAEALIPSFSSFFN